MSTELSSPFAGLLRVINPQDGEERPEALEVQDDLEGEQETLLAEEAPDDPNLSDLHDVLLQASKGVTESTDSGYQR